MVGLKYNSTMFGFAFASHQLGSFFGSWLGGKYYDKHLDYAAMWFACMGMGLFSAVINWFVSGARVLPADFYDGSDGNDDGTDDGDHCGGGNGRRRGQQQ